MVDECEMIFYIPEPNIPSVCSSEIENKLHVNAAADKFSGNTHVQLANLEYVGNAKPDILKEFDPGKGIFTKEGVGDTHAKDKIKLLELVHASSFTLPETNEFTQYLNISNNLSIIK